MRIYLVDNYDSFTYNLVHLLRDQGVAEIQVVRNDEIEVETALSFDAVLISPGPGIPEGAGELMPFLREVSGKRPIFGVCLGMQAIGELYGGSLVNLSKVYHGLQTPIEINDSSALFQDLPKEIQVGRYHSWVVGKTGFPAELEVLAKDKEGQVMAVKHRELPVMGVQFHPESVLTPEGGQILRNFLNLVVQDSPNLQSIEA